MHGFEAWKRQQAKAWSLGSRHEAQGRVWRWAYPPVRVCASRNSNQGNWEAEAQHVRRKRGMWYPGSQESWLPGPSAWRYSWCVTPFPVQPNHGGLSFGMPHCSFQLLLTLFQHFLFSHQYPILFPDLSWLGGKWSDKIFDVKFPRPNMVQLADIFMSFKRRAWKKHGFTLGLGILLLQGLLTHWEK